MTTYHLLFNEETNRLVIHSDSIQGYRIESSVEASSWIEAKKLLDFELTTMQQMMLDERKLKEAA